MRTYTQPTTYTVGTHGLGIEFAALADLSDGTIESLAEADTAPSLARLPHGITRKQAEDDRALLRRVRLELGYDPRRDRRVKAAEASAHLHNLTGRR